MKNYPKHKGYGHIVHHTFNKVECYPLNCGIITPLLMIQRSIPAGQELEAMLMDSANDWAKNPEDVMDESGVCYAICSPWANCPTPDEKKLVLMVSDDNIYIGVGLKHSFTKNNPSMLPIGDGFWIHPEAKAEFHRYRTARKGSHDFEMSDNILAAANLYAQLETLAQKKSDYYNHSSFSLYTDDPADDMRLILMFSDRKVNFGVGVKRECW